MAFSSTVPMSLAALTTTAGTTAGSETSPGDTGQGQADLKDARPGRRTSWAETTEPACNPGLRPPATPTTNHARVGSASAT